MSGDVQPRKRKDKKKKKDDLGVEEPRGTAAAFGEGDVFMHSQSEHSTGGHWCAKVIFFSLLAVLITLIGLIILENRGLTELEANSVETKYSGVLEGWIEDAPDDDHHDQHTLELKHHDEDDADHEDELEHDDDDHDNDDHDDDDENDDHENDDSEENEQTVDDSEEADDPDEDDEDDDNEDNDESEERNINTADDEDDFEEPSYRKLYNSNDKANEEEDNDDDDDDELQKGESDEQNENDEDELDANNDLQKEESDEQSENDEDDDDDDRDEKLLDADDNEEKQNDNSLEENDSDEDKILENNDDSNEDDNYLQNDAVQEDEEEHEEEEEEPANIEIETIEKEISDDDAVSAEEPAKDDDEDQDVSDELSPNEDNFSVEDDGVEFLEPDELDELPIVEPITAPKGKPLAEVEESSTETPQDTLADEEEYERQQEELRKEKEQASQSMWLKVTVGGALLVATHAVLRRATASRETDTEEDEEDFREETPLSDRRMTLISDPVPPSTVAPKIPEVYQPIEREVVRESTVSIQSSPPDNEEIEEDEEEEIFISKPADAPKDTIDKELYSDEEEIDDEEIIEPTKAIPQQAVPQTPQTIPDVTKEVTPEPDEDDDVEIIDEELLEEELEEEEDISDVDDADLLSRLEEKYGRLPEPDRQPNKDGGNSVEDEWPNEPADPFWSEHLEQAQRDLRQGEWSAAVEKASAPSLRSSARARYIAAQALDAAAEAKKDNQLLNKAIAAYLELLKMNERLSDKKLLEVASRTLDRIKFRGTYLSAEPVYKLLIRRFPDDPAYRNNLTISLLMANRADLAEEVLKETLKVWPNDRLALAHHGFILKTLHNRLEEAVEAFTKALEGDTGAANEPRFYYHLGDALILLGRFEEAHAIHKRGTALGHFLSPSQRSLYNVDRLKSKPWWNIDQTPYSKIARALEKSWKEILKEGEAAKTLYEKEKEGLKERGEWSQLDLFVRGREVPNRCSRAPVTCGIVKSEVAASGCRRGQVKFSMMEAGTHVRPHVGPTNCRLRMHLGLSNTKDTYIRVDRETRQWRTGKVLMFDDSFEHEVWHNGTGSRLVLIVDVWHPDLTPAERRQLPAI